ncbi:hypothetical protein BDV38DRAFT_282029 [Aspergillus pseudotamarii]|uniref:Uncharacterized protein n=1 Tax=Aspergillus pseudotamarii TaxID=132259 RepID=A0A5N6SUQ5_ASPPS|nr:uncharacterized protein BDV38DRAFT_282029 [Aspergillus pseudotamarii]KAE8138352.1 hypothetical protein BDV38DRAFT_282029 [Aspergillus pseudotamarii]
MTNTAARRKKPEPPSPVIREYLWMKQIGKSLSANSPFHSNKRRKTREGDRNGLETRHRFLTAYKRNKLREKSGMLYGRHSKHSHGDMMTDLGGSLYEDAELYRMNRRQDPEIYEELYGISPFIVPKMHSETCALLNDHATVLASGNYQFTFLFEQGFKGFIAALKIAKFPPYDYFRSNLNGDIEDEHPVLMRLRARHGAFEEALQKDVRFVGSTR